MGFLIGHEFVGPEVGRPSADEDEVLEDLSELLLLHPVEL